MVGRDKKIKGISYLIIFLLLIVSMTISLFINNKFFIKSSNGITIGNTDELNKQILELKQQLKIANSQVKLQDRLDPSLVTEFGSDTDFLNNIAKLKKKIIKRKLESEVIKLENEKIARDNIENNTDYDVSIDNNIARNLFDILMINATNKSAIVQIKDDVISVKVGDSVRGFKIKEITADNVIIVNPNGEEDRLTLNYLTKKIYTEEGENNAK